MGKFQVEFEITGLKLKISGEREDMPQLRQALQDQAQILLPQFPGIPSENANSTGSEPPPELKPAKKASRGKRKSGSTAESMSLPTWKHNPDKWGNPPQKWTAGNKTLWLLYVASKECSIEGLPGSAIAELFNRQFRQSGALIKTSMPSTLGSLKQKTPALVGSHIASDTTTWFLTQEGSKEATRLVDEAKGLTPAE